MGRESKIVEKEFRDGSGKKIKMKVELFPWEKLDYVDRIRKAFGMKG
jgi:S-adenosylmethionine synthetase